MGVSAVSATGCLLLCDKLCLSLAGQVEPDGRGVEKRMDALCEQFLEGYSRYLKGGNKRATRREASTPSGSTFDTTNHQLNKGQLTRLNRKLSFTLVFGPFPNVLQTG